MAIATFIVLFAEIWGAAGLCAGLAFIILGIGRIDPAARGAYAFRPLLLPGFILLWPLALTRWRALARAGRSDH